MPSILDKDGRVVHEGDADYEKVRLANLERTVGDLQHEIGDLQHRLSAVDARPVQWPGDTYEPRHSPPFDG